MSLPKIRNGNLEDASLAVSGTVNEKLYRNLQLKLYSSSSISSVTFLRKRCSIRSDCDRLKRFFFSIHSICCHGRCSGIGETPTLENRGAKAYPAINLRLSAR